MSLHNASRFLILFCPFPAYGATLSSYTWICMIVAFLQLRDPPVLPALHQMDRFKRPATNGQKTEFADDLEQLKGFGDKNKSTLGELLFQFFKFFAHEFDYENMVLSVRLGKMINKKDKTEKEWQHLNNHICVEEPFNKVRNLGNTADEFSFRGLHMEMRRAFDLVTVAKLEECCEQFVFPKHEPTESKAYVKPSPRPAIMRSSSQQHPGRGGRTGGGRGNRNHFRNGNSSRRASSSNAYENAPTSAPAANAAASLAHPMMSQGHDNVAGDLQQWSQLAQAYHHPAMLSSALMAQQDRLWYQAQLHAALVQAQRVQGHSAQSTRRSRTNSFDQAPPLSAPLRGEYYTWPAHLQQFYAAHAQAQQAQPQQYFTSYPSSPSATAVPEFRRSVHRSNAPNEGSSSNGGGMLRSQSQPASRSPAPGGQAGPNYATSAQAVNASSSYAPRQSTLSPFPAYAADDRTDSEVDDISNRTLPDSPPEEDSAGYLGYFIADSTSPRRPTQGIPALGDVGMSDASRRRLSTEGPQSVLDRRLQRTSRSPSPLGHGRNISAGANSAPLASAPFPQNGHRSSVKESSPLVVNGSTFLPSSTTWPPTNPAEIAYDNPLQISQGEAASGTFTPESSTNSAVSDRPLVVDGSAAQSPVFSPVTGAMPSLPQRMAVPGLHANNVPYASGLGDPAPSNGVAVPRNQSGLASLDLAILNPRFSGTQHLSPVYENRIPSPTVSRERPSNQAASSLEKDIRKPSDRNGTAKESGVNNGQAPRVNGHVPRENGPVRVAKGEFDNPSVWHQQKPRKKQGVKGNTGKATVQSERPPKDSSERKGG